MEQEEKKYAVALTYIQHKRDGNLNILTSLTFVVARSNEEAFGLAYDIDKSKGNLNDHELFSKLVKPINQ